MHGTMNWIMDSILDLILDWKAESMDLNSRFQASHHPVLIAYTLVPKVLIVQIPMDFFQHMMSALRSRHALGDRARGRV